MVTVGAFRMDLREYRIVFIVVTFVVALLVASPALQRLLVYPRTEFFTELWLLGPNHMAEDYPSNITKDQNYTVFLGIGNHLGYCGYYQVEVKFRNESEPAPTSFGPIENRTSSSLPSLFNVTAIVADETVWERLLAFSFDYVYDNESEVVRFSSLKFDDVTLDLSGKEAAWNSTRNGFYGDMFFELWLYNATANNFQYDGRFLRLWLNMTVLQ
jgi:uncharacterized membrane protein